jgi:glycosyltransferase involved in cell wall biosynthesis
MRILQLKTSAGTGGAETLLLRLTVGATSRGAELCTVFGEDGPLCRSFTSNSLPFRVVHVTPLLMAVAAFRIDAVLRSYRPDLILSHGARMNLIGASLGRLHGVPSISVEHNVDSWRKSGHPFHRLDAMIGRWNVCRIAVSEAVARMLVDGRVVPESKVRVISNALYQPTIPQGMAREEVRRLFGMREGVCAIISVARFARQKGHGVLLDAIGRMAERDRWKLVLVGDGALRTELEEKVSRLGLKAQVVFAGPWQPATEILSGFDVFVLPSLWEGLPVAVLEAMAAGLPVIASAGGGTPEVVRHGETGLLVPAGDAAALAAALDSLVVDPALRARMSKFAKELRYQTPSSQDWIEAHMSAWRTAAAEGRRPRQRTDASRQSEL